MNKELEKYLENALRMGRELIHAGAKSTAREGESEAATFSMDAGSALLRLCYTAAKMSASITELRLHVLDQGTLISEKDEEISRLNTRLRDQAEDLNKAAMRECELESILDDTERQRDALKVERDQVRRDYGVVLDERNNAWRELERVRSAVQADEEESTYDEVRRVVSERDLVNAKLERTRRDIDALIAKYS